MLRVWKTIICTLLLFCGAVKGFSDVLKESLALHQLVYAIRDPQTDAKRFRESLSKIGEYLALEVMQDLSSEEAKIQTLTGGVASHSLCNEEVVLVTILRGGVPLLLGMQEVFPYSEVGFLGMARNEKTLKASTDYIALPDIKNKCVIIADTMLATGGSMLDALKAVEKYGPKNVILVSAIASKQGIAKVQAHNPAIKIYSAAIDPTLNEVGYIIPGLGDAGDRAYGTKE